MKLFYRALPLFILGVVIIVTPAFGNTSVETFTATGEYVITLPGTVVGTDIDFSGAFTVTGLNFTPGSVTFEGQPVDFSGTEATFLANTYDGSAKIPNAPSSTVNGTGTGNTAGPAGNMNGGIERNGLNLGPSFSENNFELLPPFFDGVDHIPMWNSPAVPELNGEAIVIETRCTIVNVIPKFTIASAVAVVEVSITGEIFVASPVPVESKTWGAIKAFYE